MARKKKNQLPSGNFRVRVKIKNDDGTYRYISFTAPSKDEAKRQANIYKEQYRKAGSDSERTIEQAIDKYIALRENTLSPTTISNYKGYKKYLTENFSPIMEKPLLGANSDDFQALIDGMLLKGLSGKSVRNRVGLITTALDHFGITVKGYQLPAKTKPDLYIPTDEEMKKLFEVIKNTDMEVPILLAAFGPMRAGEILGLKEDAIDGNVVHVFRTMYYVDKEERIKDIPKTITSNRFIRYPDSVTDAIKRNGLPDLTHKQLDSHLRKYQKAAGINQFRFHDIRHWCASTLHAQGMPDAYIMKRGGWASDSTLKEVYRHTLADQDKNLTEKALEHFSSLL